MTVSLKGFNENYATFNASGNVTAGNTVKVSASNTVSPCSDGDVFAGICDHKKGIYACVQISGHVTVPYSGTAPALGITGIASDANGGVKASQNGRKVLVTAVDTVDGTVDFIM